MSFLLNSYRHIVSGSSFSPSDISDLSVWLDASDEGSITHSGDEVEDWTNAGSGGDAVQTTGTKKPTTGISGDDINGLNTLYFDNADCLQIFNLVLSSYFTACFITESIPDAWIEHGPVTFGTTDGFYINSSGNHAVSLNRDPVTRLNINEIGIVGSGPSFMYVRNDGVIMDVGNDDSTLDSVDSTSIPDSDLTDTLNIGSRDNATSFGTNGNFGEILIYNKALSSSELTDVYTYLTDKWIP